MTWSSARLYLAALVCLAFLGLLAFQATFERAGSNTKRTTTVGFNATDSSLIFDPTKKDGGESTIMQNVAESAPFVYERPQENVFMARPIFTDIPAGPEEPRISYPTMTGYSYVPSGIINPFTTSSTKARNISETQKSLFAYGNTLGELLFSFESTQIRAAAVLSAFFDDRTSTSKAEAVTALALEYAALAQKIDAISPVPIEARGYHSKLAESYRLIASALSDLPTRSSDTLITQAILAYDSAIEAHIKNFVGLATVFSAYDVAFSSIDAGNIFVFRESAAL